MQTQSYQALFDGLKDWSLEALVRVKSRLRGAEPPLPSWPLTPSDLEGTEVVWPHRYGWKPAANWGESIRQGLARFVHVRAGEIPQITPGLIQFVVNYCGKSYRIAIDYGDKPHIDPDITAKFTIYFKLQYPLNVECSLRTAPGGYLGYPLLYEIWSQIGGRVCEGTEKNKVYDVFGRFGSDFGTVVRAQAINILRRADGFKFEGGFAKKRYVNYLHDICKSRICIDLPGNGPFCFRLIDYFAMGACVIAFPHESRLHVPIHDGKHIVYVREDLSDLEEKCRFYLENEEERRRIGRNAQKLFVEALHRDQLASYYLHEIYGRILEPGIQRSHFHVLTNPFGQLGSDPVHVG